jgi:hypothetical protein
VSLAVATFVLAALPAQAADPTLANDMASGSVSRADPNSLSAIATSPGVLAMERKYTFGGSARFGPYKERSFHGGARDSITGPLALGVLWAGQWSTPPAQSDELPGWRLPDEERDNPVSRMTVGGSLAGAWLNRQLGVGLGVFYHRRESRYTAASGVPDLSFGVSGKLGDTVFVAASVRDMIPHQDFSDAPIEVGGGFRWQPNEWGGAEVDLFSDLETLESPELGVSLGVVGWIAKQVPLRAGFIHDPVADLDAVSAGIGVGNERGSMDYAFRLPFSELPKNTGSLGTWHGLSLVLHF